MRRGDGDERAYLVGWAWVQRLKSRGTSPAANGWRQTAVRLSKQLHIGRPVGFLESARVEVPTVIGWLQPVVLLPASALAGMAPKQIEAILAHELAHIRRHDYLVNLLQTLVETLLFYHPAVWWLSRRIRVERENCCDDLAVSFAAIRTPMRRRSPSSKSCAATRRLALAATGGSLLQRVRRAARRPDRTPAARPGWLAAVPLSS